ncbi:MAG: MBL fold metallo-hydrolase [Prevotella sp.]|nr:MBL fold metallo-hydrolase [Candidatus Prevotella equi]
MLKIKTIPCNPLGTNCYIASDETNECMIVDCGCMNQMEQDAISSYITAENLKPTLYVLTHGHFDHIMGSQWVFDTYNLQPVICDRDVEVYKDINNDIKKFGFTQEFKMPIIGRCVNDNDEVSFGSHTFKVFNTPGHSKGSVVYYCPEESIAFSGDTLFRGSIGRTDLGGGSMFQIIQSLRMLMQWPDDTRILPGHGPETTIGLEGSTNPYLDR